MANAIRSTPAIHWNCEQNIVRKFMCPLDDILDEGSKFQYSMFISFPQFIYCSHDEVYFPKLSCLIVAAWWRYSQIPLSRAPLTRENQLVAVAPWTPNFSDSSLAAAHMTEPMTHMCWSEQISPLVHSSQATWQPFNLSHCIEMHNTHLLGHVG